MKLTTDIFLSLPVEPNEIEAKTVADYLRGLLYHLWNKGERFSGKRPFGNSGWERYLQIAVIKGGFSTGTLSADPEIYIENEGDSCTVVADAIDMLWK